MPNKLPAKDKRSAWVLVAFRPIEHQILRQKAAERGSTMSSLARLFVLEKLAIGELDKLKQRVTHAD